MAKDQKESTNPKDRFGRMKPPLHLIPSTAEIIESLAMADGARKYGPYNWRDKTVAATVYLAACKRHIAAWMDGEEVARDSGVHHLGHARACLGIILDAQANGTMVDDRPTPGRAAELLERHTKGGVTEEPSGRPIEEPEGDAALLLTPAAEEILGQQDFVDTAAEFIRALKAADEGHMVPLPTEFQGQQTGVILIQCRHLNPSRYEREQFAFFDPQPYPPESVIDRDPYPTKRREVDAGKWCYIAGPMRGIEKFNFPAFDTARDLAIERGYQPISPADMDRVSGFSEDNPPEAASGAEMARTFAKRDTEALISLRAEKGDAIALLPGWEKSTGAVAEFFLARWLGLAVLDARTMEPFTEDTADWSSLSLSPIPIAARKYLREGASH